MSINAISHYLDERKDLGKDDAFAMLCLADWSDDIGECYPSMRRLSERMRITERAAQMAVKRLEKSGELLVIPGEGIATQGGRTMRFVLVSFRRSVGRDIPNQWWSIARTRRTADTAKGKKGVGKGAKLSGKGVKSVTPLDNEKRGEVERQRGEVQRAKGVKSVTPEPSVEPLVFLGDPKAGLTPGERERYADSVLELLRTHYKSSPLVNMGSRVQVERQIDEHVDLIEAYGWEEYVRAANVAVRWKDIRYASAIEAQIVRDRNQAETPAQPKPLPSQWGKEVVTLKFSN